MFSKSSNKILILRSGGIGDIFHIYPILIDLRENGYEVDLFLFHKATGEFFKEIFKPKYYSKIITLSEGNFNAFIKITSASYKKIVVLSASNETKFSVFKKILLLGFSGNIFNISVIKREFSSSRKERFLKNLKKERVLYEPDFLLKFYNKIFQRKAERNYDVVLSKIESRRLPSEFHLFILGTNNEINRLPEKTWFEIAVKVGKSKPIVLIGGKSEWQYSVNVFNHLADFNVLNKTGSLSLSESVYLISKAAKIFSHDTGIMHIAAALNTDLTVFFSSRDEFGRWHPTNSASKVMHEYQECGYCMLESCPYEKRCLLQSVQNFIR